MKKFFIVLLILILLPVLTLGIFILTFDLNRYREFAEKKLSEALNYPVSIGSMETKLAFVPTIQISNFKVMNQEKKAILTIPKMEATIEMAPLLKKQVNVQKISVTMLTIDLTQVAKKSEKEEVKSTTKATDSNKKINTKIDLSQLVWVKEFQVGKLRLTYSLKNKNETITVEDFSLTDMSNFALKVNYLKNNFEISGSFGAIMNILGDNPLLPIKLNIKTGNTSLSCNGQIKDITKMDNIRLDFNGFTSKLSDVLKIFDIKSNFNFNTNLRFSVEGNLKSLNLKKINFSLGKNELTIQGDGTLNTITTDPLLNLKLTSSLTTGTVAEKLGLNPFEITNKLKLEKGKINIDDFKYLANKTDLTGNVTLDTKQSPIDIQFDLNSLYLSLEDIFYPQAKKQTVNTPLQKSKKMIPEITLPWNILNDYNLDGQIQIKNINLSTNADEFSSITIRPNLKEGVLTATIQARLLTGTLNNILRLNQKDKSIQFKSEGKNISLDKARGLNKEFKGAFLNSEISLKTSGSTTKELLANSDGQITLEVLDGKITNKWFNTLAESFSSKKKTAFSTTETQTNLLCGIINLPLKKGILTSQDKIVLQTDALDIILNGTINLNNEIFNLTIIPTLPAPHNNNLTDLIQVIQLKGAWTDPTISINTEKVISDLLNLTLGNVLGNSTGNTQVQTKTALCEKALGHELSTVKKTTNLNKKNYQTVEKTEEKKDLKQQLFNSLSQVLRKQGA